LREQCGKPPSDTGVMPQKILLYRFPTAKWPKVTHSVGRRANSLFSQESPQDYAFSRFNLNDPNDKDDSSSEATVGKLLRDFAEKSVGAFPKRLDD
jgi:hypothetical protein